MIAGYCRINVNLLSEDGRKAETGLCSLVRGYRKGELQSVEKKKDAGGIYCSFCGQKAQGCTKYKITEGPTKIYHLDMCSQCRPKQTAADKLSGLNPQEEERYK